MKPVREIFKKFRRSDGRIKALTASGILAVAAAVALAVGVLPALGAAVQYSPLDWGGGPGACNADVGGLPSAAPFEAHDPNPRNGNIVRGPDGSEFTLTVYSNNTFDWRLTKDNSIEQNLVVYDVVVNGGPKSTHWDYDAASLSPTSDTGLHAPPKGRGFHNLSHVTICYGPPGITVFECPPADKETETEQSGTFREASVEIVQNSLWDCELKRGVLLIDNSGSIPNVQLGFNLDGNADDKVAGRLDITKMFDLGTGMFKPLRYSELLVTDITNASEVKWCETRTFDSTGSGPSGLPDGNQFTTWLGTSLYPKLPAGESACKVAEVEDLTGKQVTTVYFEFVDPRFY